MAEPSTSSDPDPDPGVEASVARPGGISYLALPARDISASAGRCAATPDHPASLTEPAT
jgi:hypothetical protein